MTPQDVQTEIALLRRDLHDTNVRITNETAALTEKVDRISTDVSGLVQAWETATNFVTFVKWLSAAGAATGGIWVMFKTRFFGTLS